MGPRDRDPRATPRRRRRLGTLPPRSRHLHPQGRVFLCPEPMARRHVSLVTDARDRASLDPAEIGQRSGAVLVSAIKGCWRLGAERQLPPRGWGHARDARVHGTGLYVRAGGRVMGAFAPVSARPGSVLSRQQAAGAQQIAARCGAGPSSRRSWRWRARLVAAAHRTVVRHIRDVSPRSSGGRPR